MTSGDGERWYWDLTRRRAVPASERGRSDDVMGPYDTRAEAEDWRSRVESRNDAWDEDDDEWEGVDDEDG